MGSLIPPHGNEIGGTVTVEQFAITERLEYVRGIVLRLARQRCADPKNFYLPQPTYRKVKKFIAKQFAQGKGRP